MMSAVEILLFVFVGGLIATLLVAVICTIVDVMANLELGEIIAAKIKKKDRW